MRRSTLFLLAFLGVALTITPTPAQDTQERVDKIFDRIEETKGGYLAEGSRELEELGRGAIEQVRSRRSPSRRSSASSPARRAARPPPTRSHRSSAPTARFPRRTSAASPMT
jgi:hypothetical protein